MYNSDTGLCSLTSHLKSGKLGAFQAPNMTEGDLYATSTCDTSDNFKYVTSGSQSGCIMVSNFATDYYSAYNFCSQHDAHLFTTQSIERFSLLPHGISYIIGLTDLKMEGVFQWEDTGEAATNDFQLAFFKQGEPNNAKGKEDCVAVVAGEQNHFGNDINCYRNRHFVCERSMVN